MGVGPAREVDVGADDGSFGTRRSLEGAGSARVAGARVRGAAARGENGAIVGSAEGRSTYTSVSCGGDRSARGAALLNVSVRALTAKTAANVANVSAIATSADGPSVARVMRRPAGGFTRL
jgi:hypothetical protein